ncbi:ABC transporter permease [Aeromicrobium piscarium]|uniref:ABC transporter permease n=1 Tax=Aeromicrobium piscarium TaxID=2590901 RepID=A0A554RWD7_9ACTN|nr:ABC transporter permease [Aeromicrobium piscarium]TSD58413.1 ABC transporter permease [Aeromicrobium piscarium]
MSERSEPGLVPSPGDPGVPGGPASGGRAKRAGRGWRALAGDARIGALLLIVIVGAAVAAPLISPFPPNQIHQDAIFSGPTWPYLLGTDELGRDLLSRLLYGARLSLIVAGGAVLLAMVLGTVWGLAAGLFGRWVDAVLMRLVDGLLAIPQFLLALLLVAALGSSVPLLIVIIGLLNAPVVARLARSALLDEMSKDYAVAVAGTGARPIRLVWREFLPNVAPPLMVQAALVGAYAILTEAGLSFLGLGVEPPRASLGSLLLQGYQNLYNSQLYAVWPGLVIVAVVWSLNVLGDRLQEVFDPRGRR